MSSSLHLPERPAWKGLEPGTAEWVPADAPTAQRFGSLLQRDGSLMARSTGKGLRGFYHLLSEDDGPDLFIRVVSPARAARLSEANDVAIWLARGGVDTAVTSSSLALPGGDLMLVQPWVEGRFAVQGPTDMAALGDGLARLHARPSSIGPCPQCIPVAGSHVAATA